jgi:hypothetical protein
MTLLEAWCYQLVKKFMPFLKPEGSLPCSQDTTTGLHFEPSGLCPYPHVLFL